MPKATNLIVPPGRSSIGKPESWPLSRDAARILGRVAPSSIPILCVGSSGTAFTRIATSVHRASGRARLERVDLRRSGVAPLLDLPRGSVSSHVTLALDGIEALDPDGQDALAAYLDDASPRLLSATRADAAALSAIWREDLLSLLATVVIETPGLPERAAEIPRLAAERLAVLCEELSIEPRPTLGPGAAAALAAHAWPGDVTEFDAVLLATILREDVPPTLEAQHLVWPRRDTAPEPPPPTRADSANEPDSDSLGVLESVAVELAHQLKNPLVTIKTFVSNAGRMDDEERGRFREIALEGIDRIDGPLDQILDFSRLTGSTEEPLEVARNLTAAFEELTAAFEDKAVTIHGLPPTHLPARGSSENLGFALSTLCRHVAETIEPHSVLQISRPTADQILLRYRESGTATNLRGATADPDSSFPLALLLVRGALIRMGGGLRTSHAQNEVTIELSFTPA